MGCRSGERSYLVSCCPNSELFWKAANFSCPGLDIGSRSGEAGVCCIGRTPDRTAPPPVNPGSGDHHLLFTHRSPLSASGACLVEANPGLNRRPERRWLVIRSQTSPQKIAHCPSPWRKGPLARSTCQPGGCAGLRLRNARRERGSGAPCRAAPLPPAAAFRTFFRSGRVLILNPGGISDSPPSKSRPFPCRSSPLVDFSSRSLVRH